MSETFKKKSEELKKKFQSFGSIDARYHALIELGKTLPPYPSELKTPNRIVSGCQSILHLNASLNDGKIFFEATSDALISAGLAALLLTVYNGETPETLLTCPPSFLSELGIIGQLSPNRSNGLAHIHLRMKQLAIAFAIQKSANQ
ncbi:MAG TPA: SufE [Parachlamydiales bacterium]|nr:SufE [Parachlamydiales bacterium]